MYIFNCDNVEWLDLKHKPFRYTLFTMIPLFCIFPIFSKWFREFLLAPLPFVGTFSLFLSFWIGLDSILINPRNWFPFSQIAFCGQWLSVLTICPPGLLVNRNSPKSRLLRADTVCANAADSAHLSVAGGAAHQHTGAWPRYLDTKCTWRTILYFHLTFLPWSSWRQTEQL